MIKFLDFQNADIDVEQLLNYVDSCFLFNSDTGLISNETIVNHETLAKNMLINLQNINNQYNIDSSVPMAKNVGLSGKIKYLIKKIINKLINWRISDLARKQTEFNASVTRFLNTNFYLVEELQKENTSLNEKLTEYMKRIIPLEYGINRRIDDSWYVKFEDQFRGDSERIKSRMDKYVKLLKDRELVLDIGCGRGELLEKLKEAHICAKGVDLNAEMVAICKKKNLDVTLNDAMSILKESENGFFDAIIALQVVEHLSLYELFEIIQQCYSKLKDDGIVIFETVNPLCLGIFCYGFYIDPTHIKPVHPAMLRFMLEEVGFIVEPIQFVDEFPDEYKIAVDDSMEMSTKKAFEKMNEQIYGKQDYYVVAKKQR